MLISHHADAGDDRWIPEIVCVREKVSFISMFLEGFVEQGHPSSKMMSRHENKFFQLRSFRNPARKFPDRRKETISYVAPFWCHKTTFAGATKLTERASRETEAIACVPPFKRSESRSTVRAAPDSTARAPLESEY